MLRPGVAIRVAIIVAEVPLLSRRNRFPAPCTSALAGLDPRQELEPKLPMLRPIPATRRRIPHPAPTLRERPRIHRTLSYRRRIGEKHKKVLWVGARITHKKMLWAHLNHVRSTLGGAIRLRASVGGYKTSIRLRDLAAPGCQNRLATK